MKRIYMILGLMTALTTAAFSQQKEIDLQMTVLLPTGDLPNLSFGDSLRFSFEIKNVGVDTLTTSDTTMIWISTNILGSEVFDIQQVSRYGMPPLTLNPGEADTLGVWFYNGDTYWGGDTPNDITFATDAKACMTAAIFGYSEDGSVFDDPGFDLATYNAVMTGGDVNEILSAFSGNNISTSHVTFGSGAGDACTPTAGIFNVKPTGLNINTYPNPVDNQLGFSYDFNSSSNATVRITDVTGRVVLTKDYGKMSIGDQKFNINVSNLNSGIYMLEFTTENGRGVSKFTKR